MWDARSRVLKEAGADAGFAWVWWLLRAAAVCLATPRLWATTTTQRSFWVFRVGYEHDYNSSRCDDTRRDCAPHRTAIRPSRDIIHTRHARHFARRAPRAAPPGPRARRLPLRHEAARREPPLGLPGNLRLADLRLRRPGLHDQTVHGHVREGAAGHGRAYQVGVWWAGRDGAESGCRVSGERRAGADLP